MQGWGISEMKKIIVYTDGACSGNPGPGGWGALIRIDEEVIELSGGEENTTNQRMEMKAPIEALCSLANNSRVEVYSDSAYLVNGFTQRWIDRWKKNGWRTSKGEPVKNRDLWEKLSELTQRHQITWHKVKGHSTDRDNCRCDQLAREAIPASD